MRQFAIGLKKCALLVVATTSLAGPASSAVASTAVDGLPAGTTPLSAAELYVLYGDKSWQWPDGAGRMESAHRRFTAWVDGAKGKSWAEGQWLITDAGRMCFSADWHSGQEVFPTRTCFLHRTSNGTIFQKKESDGEWYVFRHADNREGDEADKLVSTDLVSERLHELKPAPSPTRPAMKPQAKK